MKTVARWTLGVIALAVAGTGCGEAPTKAKDTAAGGVTVQRERQIGAQPTKPPQKVYVQDFQLDHEKIAADEGLRGRVRPLQLLPRLPFGDDPEQKAKQFVAAMSEGLVTHLGEAGVPAQRLATGALLPKEGWLVRGVFTEVNEGSRMQRAIIGFGKGETGMEVQVSVSNLAGNPDAPFIIFGTVKEPGHMPGAVVTLNPFVAAAKFAIQKNASERDVEQTAKEILQEMLKYRNRFTSEAEANRPAQ